MKKKTDPKRLIAISHILKKSCGAIYFYFQIYFGTVRYCLHTKELLLFCIIYTFIATRVQFFKVEALSGRKKHRKKEPFRIDICQATLFDTLPNVCTNVISFWILPHMEIRIWEGEGEVGNQFSYFFLYYSVVFHCQT